jgi:hypothetical protein
MTLWTQTRPTLVGILWTCIALFIISMVMCSCDNVGPVEQDLGFKIEDGVETVPLYAPYAVQADPSIPDAVYVDDAVLWWNSQLPDGHIAFTLGGPLPDIIVYESYVPCDDPLEDDCPAGLAIVTFSRSDGAILACEIIISSDITYDSEWTEKVLQHELGECLGLTDDCGPPTCVDLRSIMSSPLDPLGELTAADLERLLPYL